MPQSKFFVATRILLLDFELFIGGRSSNLTIDALSRTYSHTAKLSYLNPLQESQTKVILLSIGYPEERKCIKNIVLLGIMKIDKQAFFN
jgi:hypothetical protein